MSMDPGPYEQNTREQYERLGRFVESFEAMVGEVRTQCIRLLAGDSPKEELHQIIFHHQSLTAKPLFELFRAMTIQTISEKGFKEKHKIDVVTVDAFRGVLAQISKEYFDLVNLRNNLLHGTWFIGYVGDDPTSPDFDVYKYTVNKDGLSRIELPRTASQLADLNNRCDEVRDLVALISECIPNKTHYKVTDHFRREGGVWKRAWTWRHRQPSEQPSAPESSGKSRAINRSSKNAVHQPRSFQP